MTDAVPGIRAPDLELRSHEGHAPAEVIAAAGERVRYVHLADAWDHRASSGLRYISNPPGNPTRGRARGPAPHSPGVGLLRRSRD